MSRRFPRRGALPQPATLFITTSYPNSIDDPSGHFVRAEALAFVRRGHRVVVLAPEPIRIEGSPPEGTGRRDLIDPGIQLVRLPHREAFGWPGALPRLKEHPLRVLGALQFMREALRALDGVGPIRQVIAHWLVPSGWPLGLSVRAPLEVVVHGSDARLVLALPQPFQRWLARKLVAANATLRFVSEELRAELCSGAFAPLRSNSRVEPCALELPEVPGRHAARSSLGLAPQQRVILVVGRLVSGKRTAVAVSAGLLVPDAQVVVLGDGPEQDVIRRQWPEAQLLGRVPRRTALTWMAAADVLVSASREEGAPTTIREARALGLPVVTTPAGDVENWASVDQELYVVSR